MPFRITRNDYADYARDEPPIIRKDRRNPSRKVGGEHLTRDEVVARVREIQNAAGNPIKAHGLTDGLWRDVLTAIAEGAPNGATLAIEALKAWD